MDKYLYIRTSRTRDQYKAQSYHRHRRLSERTKLERKYAFQYIQRQLRKLIIAMKHSENFFVFCHIFCILPFTYCRHRICANASELFSGNWVFGSEISTGFHHCPTTFVNLQNGTFLPKLSYQIGNYHCPKFKSAHFAPHECHMLRLNESLQIIAHHMEVNYTISFVGDSLGGQSAIAFGCDLEWHQITAPNRVQFVDSRTLRNDLPCAKKCIEDAAYREEYKHKGPLPCLGCPDGQQRQFNTSSPNFWLNDIWPSSKIIGNLQTSCAIREMRILFTLFFVFFYKLVLNSGVWFNNMQFHTDDYEGEYDKTLQLMVPIFMDLMRKGIIIAWTAMPPIETYVNPRYEWDSFQVRSVQRHACFFEDVSIITFPLCHCVTHSIYDFLFEL